MPGRRKLRPRIFYHNSLRYLLKRRVRVETAVRYLELQSNGKDVGRGGSGSAWPKRWHSSIVEAPSGNVCRHQHIGQFPGILHVRRRRRLVSC